MADHPIELAQGTGLARQPGRLGAPVSGAVLATAAGGGLLLGLALAYGETAGTLIAMCLYLAGAGVMLAALRRGYPHAEFGPANTVTLFRLSLTAVLFGAIVDLGARPGWAVPVIAAVSLALDGVDGWLARCTRLVSAFGARFDMEVDCLLALALALLVFQGGHVGPWVLALGLARYAFWAASLALPWLSGPLPERRSRKTVCVVQIVALIVLVSPAAGHEAAPAFGGLALGFVIWSFAVDLRHLWHARP